MQENIILPIHPIYVRKILNGEKRYEYRKRLCKKDIKKLYIYETAPQKCIVGEAEVLEKIYLDKIDLWERSKAHSGITYECFLEYFRESEKAGAYFLGEIKKYEKGIRLKDIGIEYFPQSFIYFQDIF